MQWKSLDIALLLRRHPCDQTLDILDGQHLTRIFSPSSPNYPALCRILTVEGDICASISTFIHEFVQSQLLELDGYDVMANLLQFSIALLEVFCQTNFTGPELTSDQLRQLVQNCDLGDSTIVLQELECDGLYPYGMIHLPHLFILARYILRFLHDPFLVSWKRGVFLTDDGTVSLSRVSEGGLRSFLDATLELSKRLPSISWWQARAVVIHARMLQEQSYEHLPTLLLEAQSAFLAVIQSVCKSNSTADLVSVIDIPKYEWSPRLPLSQDSPCSEFDSCDLGAMVMLEWGLACHHFGFGDKGKWAFRQAQSMHGLRVELTAAMGKRTKYQRQDVAQLVVFAESTTALQQHGDEPQTASIEEPQGQPVDMLEVGRHVLVATAAGDEAALREVLLDTVETGQENIILEGGPRFANPSEMYRGGALSPLDQAIVLALCLDVNNSQASDSLTLEEMQAYVERVLTQTPVTNWMIHSTALLERSWIEFERRKTADRALMQIQALIDQHSTRLTYTQASHSAIEDAAPVQQRLHFLFQLAYPTVWELKRDVAHKYLRCQVFMSALAYFKELELWDEVVTCYQLLDKPTRAELVVREQLKMSPTPYMLTSLGDLTGDLSLYEQAWTLSRGRFARAKRTLGKIHYDRGDWAAAKEHYRAALQVQPLMHTAWYILGLVNMRLEAWEDAQMAFVRCVQQEPETGEAWANLGAIFMHTREFKKAESAFVEALKHKHDNWRILENLLTVHLALRQWRDALQLMSKLIDLRFKQQAQLSAESRENDIAALHLRELHFVAGVVADMAVDMHNEERTSKMQVTDGVRVQIHSSLDLVRMLEQLLQKITNTFRSLPQVWEIVCGFYSRLGMYSLVVQSREKQMRALLTSEHWVKDIATVQQVLQCVRDWREALCFEEVTTAEVYAAQSLTQSASRKLQAYLRTLSAPSQELAEAQSALDLCVRGLETLYQQTRSKR